MKLTIFLLLISIASIFANESYSQSKMLNLNMANSTVKEVLQNIEEQSEFYFMYSEKIVDVNRKVTINVDNERIDETLDRVFAGTDVNYKVKDRFILLTTPEVGEVQQDNTVTGKVTDNFGEPLPGVTVVVKGSTRGTITNSDGQYSLSNVSSDATLVFSFVGMRSQEIVVGNQSTINVVLAEDAIGIEEVVAIGYGSVKKSNLTGALSSVKMDDIPQIATTSVSNLLVGRVPGLSIRQNSAAPNGEYNMVIRGSASISAGNSPLYVIDGFPGGDINAINPGDIESVEVLKDASATSIYGARAANGVILVNTKKGKAGTLNISVKANTSFQTVSNPYQMVNSKDYMNLANDFFEEEWRYKNKIGPYGNVDASTLTSSPSVAFTDEQIANATNVTDWIDEITRTGMIDEEGISINGGADNVRYNFSLGHFNQKGIIINSGMEKYMSRVSLELDLTKWLTTGVSISGSQTNQDNTRQPSSVNVDGGIIKHAMYYPQYLSVYDENGNYTINPDHAGTINPVSWKEVELKNNTFRTLINNFWNLKLAKDLDFRMSWGMNSSFSKATSYYPKTHLTGQIANGKASITEQRKNDYLFDATLTYSKAIFTNHQLKVMAGYAYQKFNNERLYGANSDFISDVFGVNNLQAGGDLTKVVESDKGVSKYLSYFGRINYDIADKYLFTFTMRADGSDRFGADNKYGYFPSGAFAWRITEEDFLKSQKLVSNLKLRLSIGQTGNAEIGGNAFAFYATGSDYVLGNSLISGVSESQLPNPRLKWETTTEINVGLDWGLFKDRLSGSFEYYQKTISDLLNWRTVGSYYPVSSVADNLGKTQSKGFEITLNSVNIQNKNLIWTSDLNLYSYNDSWKERNPFSILSIYEREQDPLHVTYGYLSDGLIQAGEVVTHMPDAPPGSIKVKDINGWLKDENGDYLLNANGDKQLSGEPDNAIDDADKTIIMTSAPDLSFGLGNSIRYKNFDLSLFFYGEIGRELNNETRRDFLSADRIRFSDNVTTDALDRWSSSNPDGKYPSGLYIKYDTSTDFWIEKADFIRLKDVTFGYTLPKHLFNDIFKSTRLSFSAQNLFVITNYSGSDPETDSYTAYPNQRTYSFGVELNF
jgi:TonB-linked SusC/RagA family outer membrane protein